MNSISTTARELEREATKLLRQKGFTWAGRIRKDVDSEQYAFEQKLIIAGHNGRSTRRR